MRCIFLLLLTACSGAASPSPKADGHQAHDGHEMPEGQPAKDGHNMPEGHNGHKMHDAAGANGHKMHDAAGAKHRFDDVEKWTKVFDAPERDAWQKPAELVAALPINQGDTVADLGAGTGYFTAHLANAVGEQGTVLALEVEPNLAEHLTSRFADTKQVKVQTIGMTDAGLAADSVHMVVMLDVYHHIEGRTAYFDKVRPALHEGGKLVVVDFKEGELPVGPPAKHKIPAEQVTRELAEAGFTLESTLDLLPHQFVHIYTVAETKGQ